MFKDKKILAEVLAVLLALGNNYINKLPKPLVEYIIKNADTQKMPKIDGAKRIEEHDNISKDARIILTMFKINYWCDTTYERQEIIKKIKAN